MNHRLVSALLLLAASSSSAQYVNTLNGMQFNNMYAANADFLMSQMIQNARFQSLRLMTQQSTANAQKVKGEKPAPAAAPAPAYQFPLSATDFKPTGPRTVAEQLASAAKSPADKKTLIDMCRGIQSSIEGMPDVRKNNLATALLILLGSSIEVMAARELSDAETDELLRTINDAIASAPGFKTMSAQKRTAAYDAFLVTGGLIAGLADSGKEDPEQLALAKQLAANSLKQFGLIP